MVWNQTHNISWDACTLPSHYCSYIGQCDWLPISAMGQKGYMSLSGWPLKSPTWFSMRISWECLCIQFSSVQSLSRVQLFATPWIAAHQASLSITNSRVHPNSCPSSQWCHPAISSSIIPFSSCPQSLPASEFFSNESTLHKQLIDLSLTLAKSLMSLFPNLPLWGLSAISSFSYSELLPISLHTWINEVTEGLFCNFCMNTFPPQPNKNCSRGEKIPFVYAPVLPPTYVVVYSTHKKWKVSHLGNFS